MTVSAGFGAACPRPQIDASIMACDSSASNGWFHLRCFHQRHRLGGADAAGRALAAGLVVEELHQVDRRFRRLVPVAAEITTAAEPMKQPCGCSVSKSSGMSPFDAGRMPPEAPPGQVAVELVAVEHAAAVFVDQLARP